MISPSISQEAFFQIPEEERASVLAFGIAMRLSQLRERLFLAQAKVKGFEEKYRIALAVLDAKGLPDDASPEMHEDFILWHHWDERAQETRAKIKLLEQLASSR